MCVPADSVWIISWIDQICSVQLCTATLVLTSFYPACLDTNEIIFKWSHIINIYIIMMAHALSDFGPGMVLVRSESGQLLMIPQQTLAQMQAQAQGGMAPRTATPTNVPPGQVRLHSLPIKSFIFVSVESNFLSAKGIITAHAQLDFLPACSCKVTCWV